MSVSPDSLPGGCAVSRPSAQSGSSSSCSHLPRCLIWTLLPAPNKHGAKSASPDRTWRTPWYLPKTAFGSVPKAQMHGEPEGTWNLEKLHLELKYLGRKLAEAKLKGRKKRNRQLSKVLTSVDLELLAHLNKSQGCYCYWLPVSFKLSIRQYMQFCSQGRVTVQLPFWLSGF